ncbi:hypothetical protein [Nitrospira lenta]|uniref:PilZ domain-containing protein n=1 Tax=Nitrospira lenta TaxID=1436998 RepID=A0A330LE66_9BACT|nr:hypothetical protein [Nitrospira lenta]SPP65260.1 hypothetical protein NITLEN_30174 [Nitrospira lenta]
MRLLKSEAGRVSRGQGRGPGVKVDAAHSEPCSAKLGDAICLSVVGDDVSGGPSQQTISVWLPDGTCCEGTTKRTNDEFLFVESRMLLPVGTTISIQPTQLGTPGSGTLEATEATVVWLCPVADHFKNVKGFGVRLHASGALAVGCAAANSPKEAR